LQTGAPTDAVLEKTLQAGADVVKPVFQTKLADAIGRNTKRKSTSTGQLLSALGVSPVKASEDGCVDIKIGFNEPRKDGKRNAMIAVSWSTEPQNQPARRFSARPKAPSKRPRPSNDRRFQPGGERSVSILAEIKTIADGLFLRLKQGLIRRSRRISFWC
jgi:hypothetical protein